MVGRIERAVPGAASEVALSAEIRRAKGDDALGPVFVAVRSSTVGLLLRRRLLAEGAFGGVRFAPLGALVHRLGAVAASAGGDRGCSPRRPLTEVAVRAAARVALERCPGVFAPVAAHGATEAALAAAYRELRPLGGAELDALGATGTRAGDAVALVREMGRLLAPVYYDAVDSAAAATIRLGRLSPASGDDALEEIGALVLYLPDAVRTHELEFLGALSRRLDVVALLGATGDGLADRATDQLAGELATAFGVSAAPSPFAAGASALRLDGLLSAPDDDVEVREAVRRLLAHAEAGGDLGRCVVSYPDGARSAEMAERVARQLQAAGIPCSGGPARPLADTPAAHLLLRLVALACAPPGQELNRGEVLSLLSCGPIRLGQGLTSGLESVLSTGRLPLAGWDRASREAGVVEGLPQWRSRLQALVAELAARPDGRGARRALEAADLLEVVERLAALAAAASLAATWPELRGWAERALEALLDPGPDRERLAEALRSLDGLDAVEPVGELPAHDRLRRFASAIGVVLEQPAPQEGTFGNGPTVGSLGEVAGVSADLLLVLGCREGELPPGDADDPLLPRRERESAVAGRRTERADERARRLLLWCLAGADNSQASFARVDVRAGRMAYPAGWTAELFPGRMAEIASFAGSLRRAAAGATPADLTDFELVSLAALAEAPTSFLDDLDADYARRRRSLVERRLGGLSPFAGHVPAAGDDEAAWAAPLSATGLETFAACPFRFFLERRLGVRRLDEPERLVTMDARDRGTLMHEVLERFFGESIGLAPLRALDEDARARLRLIAAEEFEHIEEQGKTGKIVFWSTERDRILRDLEQYVERDLAEARVFGRVPISVELAFGDVDRPFHIEVPGRRVFFHGRIDRVDRTGDGRLVVVDYKSGKADQYQSIFTAPLGRGRHLQLPIYAKAAVQALSGEAPTMAPATAGPPRAEYRFVQATAAYAVVPVELTDELDGQLHEVLATLVSTIDAGAFPMRPGAPVFGSYTNCQYCDFDRLCPTDRVEVWERASGDATLKSYDELVNEP